MLLLALTAGCGPATSPDDEPYPDWVWDGGTDPTALDASVTGGDAGALASDGGRDSDDAGIPDADPGDAGADAGAPVAVSDAGARDGGPAPHDAGADAGAPSGAADAGARDGGLDAGPRDSGVTGPDAGLRDGGVADAGSRDAGAADAGRPDAGPPDAGRLDAGPSSSRHTAFPLGATDAGSGFYQYLPPGYPGDGGWPLLVFWHGVGENGNGTSELSRVLGGGIPRLIQQNQWPASRPFVVLSPQHTGGGCPSASEIHRFIGWAMQAYPVDPKAVFLTGLSCGAIGSFWYLTAFLDTQVAAAVLIAGDPGKPDAGGSLWGRRGCDAGTVALWAFHGSNDTTVRPDNSRETLGRLAQCPQPPRRDVDYVEFPGVGHDSWSRVYNLSAGYDVYDWLLAHPKP